MRLSSSGSSVRGSCLKTAATSSRIASARLQCPSDERTGVRAEPLQKRRLLARTDTRPIVGFLEGASYLRNDFLLVQREPPDLRAGLAMPGRVSFIDVDADAKPSALGFAAVARLTVSRRAGAMEHHLEAQVGVCDSAMGAREAGNNLVPAPLQNLDGVEQLDERSLDDAFGLERFEFRRAESEELLVDLRRCARRAAAPISLPPANARGAPGIPGIVNSPRTGCCTVTIIPRSFICGSLSNSTLSRTGPQGTPASPSVLKTSILVCWVVHAVMISVSASIFFARARGSSKRSSVARFGWPIARQSPCHISALVHRM